MDLEIVDELKQPEYTGENRCEPCTILNLVIAAVVGSLIARRSRLAGAVAIGVSLALIYLRGYLVPGTPTLTKRYLPPEVLRWFGKEPEPEIASGLGAVDGDGVTGAGSSRPDAASTDRAEARGEAETDGAVAADGSEERAAESSASASTDESTTEADATDPAEETAEPLELETYFLEWDVLEPCAEADDLCLTDEFETVWIEEIDELEADALDVADAVDAFGFDADPEEFELDSRDDVQMLLAERGIAGRWPSRAALLADVAAGRALEEWTDDWDRYDPETKGQVLNGLRMFLETCPTGGEISMSEETVESCCTSHEVFAVTCDETGERLFEQRLDAVDA